MIQTILVAVKGVVSLLGIQMRRGKKKKQSVASNKFVLSVRACSVRHASAPASIDLFMHAFRCRACRPGPRPRRRKSWRRRRENSATSRGSSSRAGAPGRGRRGPRSPTAGAPTLPSLSPRPDCHPRPGDCCCCLTLAAAPTTTSCLTKNKKR